MNDISKEDSEYIVGFLREMLEIISGKTRLCPRCYEPLGTMVKDGECLYGVPCGCRLWQGELPEWVKEQR